MHIHEMMKNELFCSRTRYKQMTVCIQFPDEYPKTPLIVEIKSKHISQKLINGLAELSEAEAKKHLGRPQVRLDCT